MKCAYLQLIQQIQMEPQLYFRHYMKCWAHKNWSHLNAALKEFILMDGENKDVNY